MIKRATEFAKQAHGDQQYDGLAGPEPYINHSVRVQQRAAAAGEDEITQVIALLHDTVEDTGAAVEDIRHEFGDEVAEGVEAITQRKGSEQYFDYIRRVALHPRASKVKKYDLTENLSQRPAESLARRYRNALAYLEATSPATVIE